MDLALGGRFNDLEGDSEIELEIMGQILISSATAVNLKRVRDEVATTTDDKLSFW